MNKIIWVALDKNNNIIAMWTKGYVQPFNKWKSVVKNIGAKKIDRWYICV